MNLNKPEISNSIIPKNCTVKEFFIFNRMGICLYHIDLQEKEISNKASQVLTEKTLEHRYKLIYGLLFSMRSFVKKFSVNKEREYFKSFSTSQYKLHYIELLNGLRFVILSSPTKSDYSGFLLLIFKKIYLNLISMNSFLDKDSLINNTLFDELVVNNLSLINI